MKTNLEAWLRLGRISNLPSVWSNVLAALALSGVLSVEAHVLLLGLAFSSFYVGGMYLNDAFDREIDRVQRPERPIPSGRVSVATVFGVGFAALALGVLLTTWVARGTQASVVRAAGSALLLAALIVFYDVYHKKNPLSPLVMGACRVMIYVSVAYSVRESLNGAVLLGAGCLWSYLIGLTYAAKQESLSRLTRVWPLVFLALPAAYGFQLALEQPLVWPFWVAFVGWGVSALDRLRQGPKRSVPQAVVRLIAGISLLDAMFIASTGAVNFALLAAALCVLTSLLQRLIPGT